LEVRNALNDNKAAGCDISVDAVFFKKAWNIIEMEITTASIQFFNASEGLHIGVRNTQRKIIIILGRFFYV